jgi:Mg2+ and Co2+ transporter CorA
MKRVEKKANKAMMMAPILEKPEHSLANWSGNGVNTPDPTPGPVRFDVQEKNAQPFWLDISSPTMSDMSELGKMFHLHPLTLDDINSREEREKLELFPRLGYYFIVFRALANLDSTTEKESGKEKESQEKIEVVVDEKGTLREDQEEGVYDADAGVGSVQAVNVYLAVFAQGVVSVRCFLVIFSAINELRSSSISEMFVPILRGFARGCFNSRMRETSILPPVRLSILYF